MALLIKPENARRLVNFSSPSSCIQKSLKRVQLHAAAHGKPATGADSFASAAWKGTSHGLYVSEYATLGVFALPTTRAATAQWAFPVLRQLANAASPLMCGVAHLAVPLLRAHVIDPLMANAAAKNSGVQQVLALAVSLGSAILLETPRMAIVALNVSAALALGAGGAALGLLKHTVAQATSRVFGAREPVAAATPAA